MCQRSVKSLPPLFGIVYQQVLTIRAEAGEREPEAEIGPWTRNSSRSSAIAANDSLTTVWLDDGVALVLAVDSIRHDRPDLALPADAQVGQSHCGDGMVAQLGQSPRGLSARRVAPGLHAGADPGYRTAAPSGRDVECNPFGHERWPSSSRAVRPDSSAFSGSIS